MNVLAFALARPASSDEDVEPAIGRRLAGHRFVPTTAVEWGFIDSWVSSTTLAGFSELEVTPRRQMLAAVLGTRETKVTVVSQSFAGSLAITPWLAGTLRLTGYGVVPRDTISSLAVGGHEIYRGEAGISVRLVRIERVQLTARVEFAWGETRSVIPTRLPDSPLVQGDVGTIRPVLVAAFAPARWVGLQASASYAWNRFEVLQEDRVHTLRGAVAATLSPARLPVTGVASFSLIRDFNRDLTSATSVALFGSKETRGRGELGLFYQGRRDLDLGLGVAFERDGDANEERRLAYVHMGYYF